MKQGFRLVLLSLLLAFCAGCSQETQGSGKIPAETMTPEPTGGQETATTPEPTGGQEAATTPEPTGGQEAATTPEPTGGQEVTTTPEPTAASTKQQEELLSAKPLPQGAHFLFFNPESILEDFFHGELIVYNNNWEETARFTDVMLNQQVYGVYTARYLPIGQIQQTENEEQEVRYGIYDLEQNQYSIAPSYGGMEMLDAERGYFVVPTEENDWINWNVISGTGEELIANVQMMDWITITKFGNGYLEMYYDSITWENGCTYRFYDENLKLKHVYCEMMAAMPDDEAMVAGVEYTLMDDTGCLVNADGELVLNWAIFLDKYGDGRDMDCQTRFHMVTLVEEGGLYPVLYQEKVYLLDSELNLIQLIENPVMVKAFENADFGSTFCYYLDEQAGDWVYGAYEKESLIMCDGVTPEYIEKSWGESGHLLARTFGNTLYVDEFTAEDDLVRFQIELREDMQKLLLSYSNSGYLIVSQDCGERVPDPYMPDADPIPVYEKTVYYHGTLVYSGKGISFDYIYANKENALFHMSNGNVIRIEDENAQEEHEIIYLLANLCLFNKENMVYEAENIYLLEDCNETLFFLDGEYLYAVGYDGTEYMRVLHKFN